MKLLPLLCLLFLWFGHTSVQEIGPGAVTVSEDADALLPCSLGSERKVEKFDWRKDNGENAKKEVFFYERGHHYNNGKFGQDEQFKQRVSFFEDELKTGNASIKITNTHLEDNGTYICVIFEPYKKEIQIRLNVDSVLKKRNVTGAASEPHVKQLMQENKWTLLECKVLGVPKPEVEWRNSAGEVLAKLTNFKEIKERFLKLYVNVTKSDNYTCVATQMSIFHQINNTLEVKFYEQKASPETPTKWIVVVVVLSAAVVLLSVIVVGLLVHYTRKTGSHPCNPEDDFLHPTSTSGQLTD